MSSDFPGRPDHPDFWVLSRVLIEMDAQADSAQGAADIIARYLDPESVTYAAIQRASISARNRSAPGVSQLAGLWIDGLITGMMVQHLKTAGQEERS